MDRKRLLVKETGITVSSGNNIKAMATTASNRVLRLVRWVFIVISAYQSVHTGHFQQHPDQRADQDQQYHAERGAQAPVAGLEHLQEHVLSDHHRLSTAQQHRGDE